MYYSMDAVTQRQSNSGSGAASAVALGVLCGVLAALAIQPASHSSTAAWAAPSTAAATRLAAPRTMPVQRVTPALSGRTALAATAVDPAGHAPLDPLMLNGPPAPLRGPARALLILVGAMLLPAVGLVLLYRKLCVRSSSVALEEEFDEERMSMAAAAALDEEEVETTASATAAPAAPKPQSKRVKPPYAHFSKRRRALESMYQRKQLYPLEEALRLAKETSSAKFTESIDVAVNLGIDPRKSDQMVRGSVVLPAGTGKVVRVAAFCQGDAVDKAKAAGAEFYGLQDLAELIKGGELGFDVVVATPDAMRVALQLGKILGPRGLMPNPKDGTVNVDIEQAIRNAKAGQVKYRSDKAGSIHIPVGKTNFDIANLKTNVNAFLKELIKVKPATVKGLYMKKVVVSSTMGPGIYVDIGTTEAAR